MSRRSWHRVVAALLVVTACSLTLPAKAAATSMTLESLGSPIGKVWNAAMDWFLSRWKPATGTGRRAPGVDKFGAGHSSDGHTAYRSGF